jgi:hypothetical protein
MALIPMAARAAALTVLLFVLFATVVATTAEAHKGVAPKTCGIKGARTAQLTHFVRVVAKVLDDGDRVRTWACSRVFSSDRAHVRRHGFRDRRLIGDRTCDAFDESACDLQTVIATSASRESRLAFTYRSCHRFAPHCTTGVTVIDLGSGERASTEFNTHAATLASFELTGTGTAVWLAETAEEVGTAEPPNYVEIVAGLTFTGQEFAFDEGPDLSDLALGGDRLYWMSGDEPQTAEVP